MRLATHRARRGPGLRAVATGALVALGLAACSPPKQHAQTTTTLGARTSTTASTNVSIPTTSTTTTTQVDNIATFAEPAGQTPSFIAPITPAGYGTTTNTAQFSSLMWSPLVWPGTGEQLGTDTTKSLFSSIAYNQADTSVTITLKNRDWSDGQPVTARDLAFYINLVTANKADWSAYVPGQFPDNITGAEVTGKETLVLRLKGSWSQFWFTDDELSLLTPVPQHVWDKESTKGKVGNYDETAAGAKAVWAYLVGQARDTATFATNPLWKVVDGPWELHSFGTGTGGTSAGKAVFVPNPDYSGSDTPTLSEFVELPFANATDEVDALAAGEVDVGYVPFGLLADRAILRGAGFNLTPWVGLDLAGLIPNLTNRAVAPLLDQTYVRQALQELIDQSDLVSAVYAGYASPNDGPVPLAPAGNPYVSPAEIADPFAFSTSKAAALLADHGWQVGLPGHPATCAEASACGPGITKGETLTLDLAYPTGDPSLAEEVEVIKSAAIQAGVVLNLKPSSPTAFAAEIKPCTTTCSWELATHQGYPYKIEPTGENLFVKGAAGDLGGYDSATNVANVAATLHDNQPTAFYRYEDYLATQLPWIWLPAPDYQLTEVTSSLQGVTPQDAYLYLSPQDWAYSS